MQTHDISRIEQWQLQLQVPKILGKPEAAMMVQVDAGQTIIHGGSAEPAANVQLYSIGAVSKSACRPGSFHCPALKAKKCILSSDPEVNVKVSAAVADIVSEHLQVSKTRYFLQVMRF